MVSVKENKEISEEFIPLLPKISTDLNIKRLIMSIYLKFSAASHDRTVAVGPLQGLPVGRSTASAVARAQPGGAAN